MLHIILNNIEIKCCILDLQKKINDKLTNSEYNLMTSNSNYNENDLKSIIRYKQELLSLEKSALEKKIQDSKYILEKNTKYLSEYVTYTN